MAIEYNFLIGSLKIVEEKQIIVVINFVHSLYQGHLESEDIIPEFY